MITNIPDAQAQQSIDASTSSITIGFQWHDSPENRIKKINERCYEMLHVLGIIFQMSHGVDLILYRIDKVNILSKYKER